MILLPILLPVVTGILLILSGENGVFSKRNNILIYTYLFLLLSAGSTVLTVFAEQITGREVQLLWLFAITDDLGIVFDVDGVGRIFALLISLIWVLAGFFSAEYMKHEDHNKRYFGFYLSLYGILMGLCFSANLITFYGFYELMTVFSAPLVLHSQSREAIMAGLKYMFYSFCGAYMSLFGLYFLCRYIGVDLSFVSGGSLAAVDYAGHEGLLLVVAFLMILGFSVKAGMFPMHAWLPTAHPVAPAPASAVLSAIIVKAGVLGIIRVVFYLFGADFLRGTWVQTTWMILSLLTVFMGSMLAYREDVLKKRLAYSTVSQLSYILFGLAVLDPAAMTGSLLHVVFHAVIKALLFLGAGAIIYKTGCHKVSELDGIGKKMPVTVWCFAIASLGLIGIPPTGGFLSKWYLAMGALKSQIPVFAYVGPVILLVSALLTAGYLLPVAVKGFFPGKNYDYENHKNLERDSGMAWMLIPMLVLAVLVVLPGMFPQCILDLLTKIVSGLM